MKKFLGVILVLSLSLSNFINLDSSNAISISSKEKLKKNIMYYEDLNGDGKKEKIMIKHSIDSDGFSMVKLYINSKLKKKYIGEYSELGALSYPRVYLCDFNKYDKKKEIYIEVIYAGTMGLSDTNIFRYEKNNKFKNYLYTGSISSYNNKTGEIKISKGLSSESAFKSFENIIGGNFFVDNYLKVQKDKILKVSKKNTNICEKYSYIVRQKLTVYKSTSSNNKVFTLYPGDEVYLQSIYNTKNKKYIKVCTPYGKKGWVKVNNSRIFE